MMKTLARDDCRSELLRRLGAVTPDSARRWGTMSAPQMVCHLADAFRMGRGARAVSEGTGPLQRTVVKWVALYAPMRWPSNIVTRPELDALHGGTPPGAFAADVAEVAVELDAFLAHVRAGRCLPHPIFGRLSPAAWLRWGYLHTDHHLRQFGH
jgi:Protein of unknown function (DUF1569)